MVSSCSFSLHCVSSVSFGCFRFLFQYLAGAVDCTVGGVCTLCFILYSFVCLFLFRSISLAFLSFRCVSDFFFRVCFCFCMEQIVCRYISLDVTTLAYLTRIAMQWVKCVFVVFVLSLFSTVSLVVALQRDICCHFSLSLTLYLSLSLLILCFHHHFFLILRIANYAARSFASCSICLLFRIIRMHVNICNNSLWPLSLIRDASERVKSNERTRERKNNTEKKYIYFFIGRCRVVSAFAPAARFSLCTISR